MNTSKFNIKNHKRQTNDSLISSVNKKKIRSGAYQKYKTLDRMYSLPNKLKASEEGFNNESKDDNMLNVKYKRKRRRFKTNVKVQRQSSTNQIKSTQNYLQANNPNHLQANTVIFSNN